MRSLALLAVAALAACATGTTIVTGTQRPATDPSSITLYTEAPPHYEVIGLVTGYGQTGLSAQGNLDRAIQDVRERAAAIGATGVIIDYAGVIGGAPSTIGTSAGGVTTVVPVGDAGDREVRGRAIFVQG